MLNFRTTHARTHARGKVNKTLKAEHFNFKLQRIWEYHHLLFIVLDE